MSDHPHRLAVSLARPVCLGYISRHEAWAAIGVHIARAERAGRLDYDPGEVASFSRWLLASQIKRLETKRSVTALHIVRLIRPMIATSRPRNQVLAEAHGCNGEADFPFAEPEVEGIVAREYYFAGRRRNA